MGAPALTWFVLLVLSHLVAALASAAFPNSALEKSMALWPPSQPFSAYLQRVLINPIFRWDAIYFYQPIAANGYQTTNGSLAYYPLLPYLARFLTLFGVDPFVGLWIVITLAGLGFVLLFERLARLDLPSEQANWVTQLLLIFPISLIIFIPYPEPLFLFLATASLYFMRRERWWLAGLMGFLATLARQVGIFLVIPMVIELWIQGKENRRWSWQAARNWLAAGLIPLAMAGWTLFRIFAIEKVAPDTSSVQKFILTTLLSSKSSEVAVTRPFAWPWQVLAEAVTQAVQNPLIRLNVLFNMGGYFLVALLLILAWKRLRLSYRIFSLVIVALSLLDFSFNLCALPIPSLFRHAYLAFPLFIGLPELFKNRWTRLAFVAFSLALFILLVYVYGVEGWVV